MVIVPQRWRSRFKTHGKLENPPTQRRFSGPTIGKTHRKYEKKQYRWRFIAGKIIHGDSANHVRLPEATGCLEDYTPNGNRIAQQTSTNDHHYWDFQHSSNGFQGCSQSQGEGLDTKKDLVKKNVMFRVYLPMFGGDTWPGSFRSTYHLPKFPLLVGCPMGQKMAS